MKIDDFLFYDLWTIFCLKLDIEFYRILDFNVAFFRIFWQQSAIKVIQLMIRKVRLDETAGRTGQAENLKAEKPKLFSMKK